MDTTTDNESTSTSITTLERTAAQATVGFKYTVLPVQNGHSQKDHKLVFKTNYRLMQVKVLQYAPRVAYCNTFDLQ